MTAICGGGTSSAKSGVGQAIYITSAAAGALLNNIPVKWAVPLAALIGARTYDAGNFCSQDPPADPGITAADVVDLVAHLSNPFQYAAAADKVAQLISRYAWYQWCKCDSVSTPAPPAAPAQPTNMPTLDLGPPQLSNGTRCHDTFQTFSLQNGSFNYGTWRYDVPNPDPRAIRVVIKQTVFPAGISTPAKWSYVFFDNNSLPVLPERDLPQQGSEIDVTLPSLSGYTQININGTAGYNLANAGTLELIGLCGGGGTIVGGNSGCCDDPALKGTVDQIYQALQLLQRQIAPYAFVTGAAHPGLSGAGNFSLTKSLVGIKLDCTTVPARAGLELGDPDAHFDLGWVSIGDADGWFATRPIRQLPLKWTPRWMSSATKIGYSLTQGVVARIDELEREA